MKTLERYYSIVKICPFLVVQFIIFVSAEDHDIQSRNYEHPRFGDSSIRSCAFNQYLDEEEGRCMIIPGGGKAISIDHSTTCKNEALRGHQSNPRIYYVCRQTKTILAECEDGKYFDNRLKRCATDVDGKIDESRNSDSNGDTYEHLDLPACVTPGSFPVSKENCSLYYSCTSNGFRLFRTMHKCPPSTGFDPFVKKCTEEASCPKENVSTRKPKKEPEVLSSTTKFISTTAPTTKFSSTTVPTIKFSSTTVPTTKLSSTTVPTTKFSSSTVPMTKFSSTTVPMTKFSSKTVPTTKFSSTTVPTTKFSSTTVPTTKFSSRILPTTNFSTSTVPTTKFNSTTPETTKFGSTTLPPRPITTLSIKAPENPLETLESTTKFINTATTVSSSSTKAPEILASSKNVTDTATTPTKADNETKVHESTKRYFSATTLSPPNVAVTIKTPNNQPEDFASTKIIDTTAATIDVATTNAPDKQSDFSPTKFIDTTTTKPTPPTIVAATEAPIVGSEMIESTTPSIDNVSSIDKKLENPDSTTAEGGEQTTIYIKPNQESSVTEKISVTDSVTERTTNYQRTVIPSKSTIFVESLDKLSEAQTIDYSSTTEAINEGLETTKIIHTTAESSDYETTEKSFTTTESGLYNTYADDYVTLRSEKSTPETTPDKIPDDFDTTTNKNDETTTRNSIDEWTSEDTSSTDVTIGISKQYEETTSTGSTISDFWSEDENSTESTVTMDSINDESTTTGATSEDLKTSEDNFIDSTTIISSTTNVEETTNETDFEDSLRTSEKYETTESSLGTSEKYETTESSLGTSEKYETTESSLRTSENYETTENLLTTSEKYETSTVSSTGNDEAQSSSTIENSLSTSERYETTTNEIISTSERNYEASSTTIEDSWTSEQMDNLTDATVTISSNPQEITTEIASTEESSWTSDSYETATESSNYNATEKSFFDTTTETSYSTILDEVPSSTIEGINTPISTLDASEDPQYTKIASTTSSEFSLTESTLSSNEGIDFTPEQTTIINDVTPTKSDNDYFSTESEFSISSSSDSSPSNFASSTPQYENEEINTKEKFSTEGDFTTADPYKNPSSLSSDFPENKKLSSEGSIMSTTEAEITSNQQEVSTASPDLLALTQQDEEFVNGTADSASDDTRTSPVFSDDFTEKPSQEIDLDSTTISALVDSTSSELSQLEDSHGQDSTTLSSAISNSEQPTINDYSVDSTNLLSTSMPILDLTTNDYPRVSTDATTENS